MYHGNSGDHIVSDKLQSNSILISRDSREVIWAVLSLCINISLCLQLGELPSLNKNIMLVPA